VIEAHGDREPIGNGTYAVGSCYQKKLPKIRNNYVLPRELLFVIVLAIYGLLEFSKSNYQTKSTP
jgi:hypothetical protein